jgi:hypothetical protein
MTYEGGEVVMEITEVLVLFPSACGEAMPTVLASKLISRIHHR